jgi:hypothetical protein
VRQPGDIPRVFDEHIGGHHPAPAQPGDAAMVFPPPRKSTDFCDMRGAVMVPRFS